MAFESDPRHGHRRAVVEGVEPQVDCGTFPVKRTVGEILVVEADVFADGHDRVAARLLYRHDQDPEWSATTLAPLANDRFRGSFRAERLGRHRYTVEGWVDAFASWAQDLEKRVAAGQEVSVDLAAGAELVRAAAARASGPSARQLAEIARYLAGEAAATERVAVALGAPLAELMARHPDLTAASRYFRELPLEVDPERARFSAWYELFPRSASPEPDRHGTFADVEGRLDYVAAMGFDVLYLPPIHPIGRTARKGKNNATTVTSEDVGSPWAIGSADGGHTAIHPALGSLADFRRLVASARQRGIEVALDLAFQCSPDHPWVEQHPEWFRWRPDGTIQHAENPPKRYEDIVPLDFESPAWRDLWQALREVVEHWIAQGVTIFRVDNPHTKAFHFWQWLIGEVRAAHPEVIFLSEAFTRPKVMYRLAKLGFHQSYNYFPWRTTKRELIEYLSELTRSRVSEYFRPNLWPNTPDILTEQLQHGGRAGFVQRLVLAATLGASYGVYGPAFELMESVPREPGSEEYLDSEKYQLRHWPLERPDSLRELIGRINRLRRANPALQSNRNLVFHGTSSEAILCYSKATDDASNAVLVVVNLDPHHRHGARLELDLAALGVTPGRPFQVHDLLTGARYLWQQEHAFFELDPQVVPAAIFRLRRRVRSERDFDYFM
jgi:starch synthase (maltosyl-transferring)